VRTSTKADLQFNNSVK